MSGELKTIPTTLPITYLNTPSGIQRLSTKYLSFPNLPKMCRHGMIYSKGPLLFKRSQILTLRRNVHNPARSYRSGEVTSLKAKSALTQSSSGTSELMSFAAKSFEPIYKKSRMIRTTPREPSREELIASREGPSRQSPPPQTAPDASPVATRLPTAAEEIRSGGQSCGNYSSGPHSLQWRIIAPILSQTIPIPLSPTGC